MKNSLKYSTVFLLLFLTTPEYLYSQSGDQLFLSNCRACHTVGGGKLVGPDLKDVTTRRTEQWLLSFIKSSQTLINSSDKDAVALFNEYNKVQMPDQNLSEAQIKDILAYITKESQSASTTNVVDKGESIKHPVIGKSLAEANRDDINTGKEYFEGTIRFANGGPSCISCHNVDHADMISGGLFAIDLTLTVSRLGPTGVHAMITNPGFPAMKTSFQNNSITPEEAFYLTAFLMKANSDSEFGVVKNSSGFLFNTGLMGSAFLFIVFGGIWWDRKRKSVNHDIFKRQIKSK